MSTRCQIGFYEAGEKDITKFQALLYKHNDGYPEGVLKLLMPFLEYWSKARGMSDLEYCSARFVQHMGNSYDKLSALFAKEMPMKNSKQEIKNLKQFTGVLSIGISKQFHGDIEFFYGVYSDGTVKVFMVNGQDWDEPMKKRVSEIVSIPVEGYEDNKYYQDLITKK